MKKGAPNFNQLSKIIREENWDNIEDALTVKKSVESWSKHGFKLENGSFYFEGEPIPNELNTRILDMSTRGEDPISVINFWKRLKKNPSKRSVDQLWDFLRHKGIPLTKAGTFLAYKGVRSDFKDQHSGLFSNVPGAVLEMERNKVSDDPREACHEGFHVGSLEYARGFSSRVVVCEVDPENVVSVPYDSSNQKMRVCRYKVLGNHNDELLPSTSVEEEFDAAEQEEEIPVQVESKVRKGEQKVPQRTLKKSWKKFHEMGFEKLMEQTIEDLRKYAGKGLDIVGASKIPGGKTMLVAQILKARD